MNGHEGARARCIDGDRRSTKVQVPGYARRDCRFRSPPYSLVSAHEKVVVGGPTTDVDAALLLMQPLARISRIFQRLPRFLQEQPLLRIDQGGFAGRDPEEGRIEPIDRIDETAVAAILLALVVRVHAIRRVPSRDLSDQVSPLLEVAPERIEGLRFREPSAHPDDGDRLGSETRGLRLV